MILDFPLHGVVRCTHWTSLIVDCHVAALLPAAAGPAPDHETGADPAPDHVTGADLGPDHVTGAGQSRGPSRADVPRSGRRSPSRVRRTGPSRPPAMRRRRRPGLRSGDPARRLQVHRRTAAYLNTGTADVPCSI